MYYNVYLISSTIEGDTCYKIGYTKRDPIQRIKEMKTGNASELEVIQTFKSKWGTQIESKLHKIFQDKKISGEWFRLTAYDISQFKKLCEQTHQSFELLSENNTWFQNSGLYKKFN
jgi:hypothetical protein